MWRTFVVLSCPKVWTTSKLNFLNVGFIPACKIKNTRGYSKCRLQWRLSAIRDRVSWRRCWILEREGINRKDGTNEAYLISTIGGGFFCSFLPSQQTRWKIWDVGEVVSGRSGHRLFAREYKARIGTFHGMKSREHFLMVHSDTVLCTKGKTIQSTGWGLCYGRSE